MVLGSAGKMDNATWHLLRANLNWVDGMVHVGPILALLLWTGSEGKRVGTAFCILGID